MEYLFLHITRHFSGYVCEKHLYFFGPQWLTQMKKLPNFFIDSQKTQTSIGFYWNFDKHPVTDKNYDDINYGYNIFSKTNIYYRFHSNTSIREKWIVQTIANPKERPRRNKQRSDIYLENEADNSDEYYEEVNMIDPPFIPRPKSKKRSRRSVKQTPPRKRHKTNKRTNKNIRSK